VDLLERNEPLSRLSEAAAGASNGRGCVVVVRGEAGVGKTSLVRAFLDSQSAPDDLVGRCDDSSVPVVLGPFRDLVSAEEGLPPLDVDRMRQSVMELLAERQIVVVEDVHWADEASLDLITFLAKRIASAPALLVLTLRAADNPHVARCLAQIPAVAHVEIDLEPLSVAAVHTMANQVGRDGQEIFDETAGNPFLVTEALSVPVGALPNRVVYAASARLSRVSEVAVEFAGFISVFPSGVAWEHLEGLWAEADPLVDELDQVGLLGGSTSRLTFQHELMRRAIEDSLPPAVRRRFNGRIIESLDLESADSAIVAHHAHAAGDMLLFVQSTVVAARDFARAGAHRDALAHLERAAPNAALLQPRDRAGFAEALANELVVNGRFADADPIIHDAVEQWRTRGDLVACARALNVASKTSWRRGLLERSLEEQREALSMVERSSDVAQIARTRVLAAQLVGMLSRWPEALPELDRAVAEASGIDFEAEAMALGVRGNARRILGDESGGSADEIRSIDLAVRHDLPLVAMTSFSNRVATSLGSLELAGVEQQLADGLAHAGRVESENGRVALLALSTRLDLIRGRWDEAMATAGSLHAGETDDPLRRVASLVVEGLIRVRRGDDTGIDLLKRASERASAVSDIQRLGPVGVALAELLWLGKVNDAAEVLAIGELARSSGHVRFRAELAVWFNRLGLEAIETPEVGPSPLLAALAGDWRASAEGWATFGCPYHRLLALGFSDDPDAMREAVDEAMRLGAVATADRLRARLRELGHRVSRGQGRSTLTNPGRLTRRQVDVVRLLARGQTNQQIAKTLFISAKTVDHHVSAVLTRLGVSDRQAAGRWALEQGLT